MASSEAPLSRISEVEILATTLDQALRTPVQRALQAHKQGNLSLAAQVMSTAITKDVRLRWAGLLLALDATELKLAGSVVCQTPTARFAASKTKPNFQERWSAFNVIVWPEGEKTKIELIPEKGRLRLQATPAVNEAARIVAGEVSNYLGCIVDIGRA